MEPAQDVVEVGERRGQRFGRLDPAQRRRPQQRKQLRQSLFAQLAHVVHDPSTSRRLGIFPVAVGWWSVDDAHASWEDRVDFGRYAGMPARVILAIAAIMGSIILGGPTAAMGAQVIRQPSSEVVVSAVAGETNTFASRRTRRRSSSRTTSRSRTPPPTAPAVVRASCVRFPRSDPGVGVRLNLGDGTTRQLSPVSP